MAKKNEFKPDKPQSGVLSKLYLTRKQRQSILKWLLYSLVLLVLSVLQDVILCRLRINGATTDLVSAGILLLCIMLPTDACAVFALISSTLFYFSGMAAGPYSILLLTGLGIVLNIFRSSYLRKGFSTTLLCSSTALLLYEMLVFVLGLFLGHTTISRVSGFLLTWIFSVAAMPLLYPLFLSIGNIGGESWKE